MSDPNFSDLRTRLEALLEESAEDLRANSTLRSRFPLGASAVDVCARTALTGLIDGLRRQAPRLTAGEAVVEHDAVAIEIAYHGSTRPDIDTAVIVPLGNPSRQLQERCLLSVASSFEPERTLIILYRRVDSDSHLDSLRGFTVVEMKSAGRFSLPSAYSNCVACLRSEFAAKWPRLLLVFMDDDAAICAGQAQTLEQHMRLVRSGSYVLVSGHYYDETPPRDAFSAAIECSGSATFVSALRKPYCHGGAAMMLESKNFPSGGLPKMGLGGISIGVLLIEQLEASWQSRLAAGDWYILNNPTLRVLHPRKPDLLQWTATYLGYTKAWGAALKLLSPSSRSVWERRLETGRQQRFERLVASVDNTERGVAAVANLLLTRFFKPKLAARFAYEEFQGLGLHVHSNLK